MKKFFLFVCLVAVGLSNSYMSAEGGQWSNDPADQTITAKAINLFTPQKVTITMTAQDGVAELKKKVGAAIGRDDITIALWGKVNIGGPNYDRSARRSFRAFNLDWEGNRGYTVQVYHKLSSLYFVADSQK